MERRSRNPLIGHFFCFPHHFSPAPCTPLQLSPHSLNLTCYLHTLNHLHPLPTTTHTHSPATTHCLWPLSLTYLTIFPMPYCHPSCTFCPSLPISPKIFLLLTNYNLCIQIVFVSCARFLLFCRGLGNFWSDCSPLGMRATHHLFDRSLD